jgi:hypothetical protein
MFIFLTILLKKCFDRNNIDYEREGNNLLNEEEINQINELRDMK